jgi:outer membrane receptor protein involved in Fe transport
VQDLITLNDQWQVSVGGRYDQQKKENADNESFLPKAAILLVLLTRQRFMPVILKASNPKRANR